MLPSQRDDNCPPYIGGALKEDARPRRLTLEELGQWTVSLTTVSFNTPLSLTNAVGRWAQSGLLGMVDERVRRRRCGPCAACLGLGRCVGNSSQTSLLDTLPLPSAQVMFLSAPRPAEVELGIDHGFRVITPEPEDLSLLMARHRQRIFEDAGNEMKPRFPYVFNATAEGARVAGPSMWVAPALLFSLHETASRVSIFVEKVSVGREGGGGREVVPLLRCGCA
jgi:hypothetical protein